VNGGSARDELGSLVLPPSPARLLAAVGIGVVAFPVAVLLSRLRGVEDVASLPYVAVVIAVTAVGRAGVGAVSVVVGALLLDYHALEPIHSLSPESPADIIAVVTFAAVSFATALVVSRLERLSEARRRAYERLAATTLALQRRLLPDTVPRIPRTQLQVGYWPIGEGLEVGGDFYDVIPSTPGRWLVVIGDVSGKGPDAAAIVGIARYTLRALARDQDDPARLLERLNGALVPELPDGTFCTICVARLDVSGDRPRITVACAGHPPPYVVRADGEVEVLDANGALLGMLDEMSLEVRSTELEPRDTVVLYTDGLYERPAGVGTDERDLGALLAGASSLTLPELTLRIEEDLLVDPPADDTALLLLRHAA
jgi:serine phosphatase RsbU (regulator of sigma subunit)